MISGINSVLQISTLTTGAFTLPVCEKKPDSKSLTGWASIKERWENVMSGQRCVEGGAVGAVAIATEPATAAVAVTALTALETLGAAAVALRLLVGAQEVGTSMMSSAPTVSASDDGIRIQNGKSLPGPDDTSHPFHKEYVLSHMSIGTENPVHTSSQAAGRKPRMGDLSPFTLDTLVE